MINTRYDLGHSTLIAEDDRNFREVFSRVCWDRFASYCFEVEDGCQGIETIINNARFIKRAIIDLNIPRMNGLELVRMIRDRHGFDIKIAVASVSDDPATKRNCFEFGADVFVSKNESFDQIISTLSRIF